VKFVPTKKGLEIFFSSPLSLVVVFGSEIRDPGWVKIRIRDKHPGSATLFVNPETGSGASFFRISDPKPIFLIA
jgi:hypothetical protein